MQTRRLIVVYADDDDLVRETISALLILGGIDVYACAGGAEALLLCEQKSPDTALLDLNMPNMDGLETARRLRAYPTNHALRIVALTGRGTWELRMKALDAGFDEFLTKPISTAALVRALHLDTH